MRTDSCDGFLRPLGQSWTVLGALALILAGCGDTEPKNPSIGFLFPANGQEITPADDVNDEIDGIQVNVQVAVLNYNETGTLTLQIQNDANSLAQVPVNGDATYLFADYTLPAGEVPLSTALLNDDGQTQATASIAVEVDPTIVCEPLVVAITEPAEDGAVLTLDDDVDGDPFNGLQIDVAVETECLDDGTELTLIVGALLTETVTVSERGATFSAVTLPVTGPDGSVDLRVVGQVGLQTVNDVRTVVTDVECVVSIDPAPAAGACQINGEDEDLDPDTPGFQTELTVLSNCPRAVLTVNEDSDSAFVDDGEAVFVVTFEEGENTVVAEVSDTNPTRSATSDEDAWFVDTDPPTITITSPREGDVIVIDRDGDPENGFQIGVEGTSEGAEAGADVDVLFDGDVVETVSAGDEGQWFTEVTVADEGALEVGAETADACANVGEADSVNVQVVTVLPTVGITSPLTDTAQLADGDDTPGGLYEMDFELALQNVDSGLEASVECRRPTGLFGDVGSATADGSDTLSVPVAVDIGEWFCRAAVPIGQAVSNSPVIRVFFDNVAPSVTITTPADASSVREATVALSAFVSDVDPEGPVTITVNDGDPVEVEVVGGGVNETVTLAQGANVITLTAQEIFDPEGLALDGNVTSQTVNVTYDVTPPMLTYLAPTGDVDESDPGYDSASQTFTVRVQSDETPVDGRICLTANSAAEVCDDALEPSGDNWIAEFPGTFLLPGANSFTARATDAAGNEGSASLSFNFTTALPRIDWAYLEVDGAQTSPVDGAVIATSDTVDFGLTTELAGGTSLALYLNEGAVAAATVPVGPDGSARFDNVLLLDEGHPSLVDWGGFNRLEARVPTDATLRSPVAEVRVDETAPTIAFRDLSDGQSVSLAAGFVDASPDPGFQLETVVTVDDVEANQPVTLDVACDIDSSYDDQYVETVSSGELTFFVTVPDEDTCTFVASVSDVAGNPATPAEIDLDIDVAPPICAFTAPTDGALIDASDDLVPGDDIEIDVIVSVSGALGDVTLTSASGTVGPITKTVASRDPIDVTYALVTLPDGEVTLQVATSDPAGNTCEASVRITVVDPDVTIRFLTLEDGDNLNTATDQMPEEPGHTDNFTVIASASFSGESIQMCRAIAPGGVSCEDAEFEIVGTTQMVGATGTFMGVLLPDDPETVLLAELDLGALHIPSIPVAVCVDTVRPTIDAWTLDNDVGVDLPGFGLVGADDGFLNAAEAPGRQAVVTLALGGVESGQRVQLFSSAVGDGPVATGTTDGSATIALTTSALPAGAQTLRAELADACGNPPAAGSPTLALTVDATPPTLAWSVPSDGGRVLAAGDTSDDPGAQIEILLLTDAPVSMPVDVSGLTLLAPPDPEFPNRLFVDAEGDARGPATLAEGQLSLSALVVDPAFNARTAVASVLVDVTAPTIVLSLPDTVEDADPAAPGFQLDVTVTTTQAETGQLIGIVSSITGGQIGSTNVGTTTGADLSWSGSVRLDMPVGSQDLTASVSDVSGNATISPPVAVTIDVVGCGLVFLTPPGSPVLVDATGYSGSGPKAVNAQLVVVDVAGCGNPDDPATVRVRIGCAVSAADDDCDRVYTTTVSASGQATFAGPTALEFFDDEVTTMHGIVEHPDTAEVSTTEQKDVIVSLTPATVIVARPGVTPEEQVLSRRDMSPPSPPGSDWTRTGTTVIGPLEFTAVDGYGDSCSGLPATRPRCSYTVQYADGTVLEAGGVPLQDVAINTAGSVEIQRPNVSYPTMAGATGSTLEVRLTDQAGNLTVESVPLNVDADPPSTPGSFEIDGSPYVGSGGDRSGRSDLSWTAASDDSAAGANVARYELRALCATRTSRAALPGGPVENCADAAWTDIETWEDRALVAEVVDGSIAYALDAIGLDEDWTLGLRAFDEADNWSAVNEGALDTTLERLVVASYSPLASSTTGLVSLGDVNGDGQDDLLATSGSEDSGGGILILGEATPTGSGTTTNLLTIDAPAAAVDATWFGSSVGAAGDINGDGFADFAIGSPYVWFFDSGENRVYLYFGGPTDSAAEITALLTPDSVIEGPVDRFFEFIFSVRSGAGNFADYAGDDPFDDVVFAATDVFVTEASDLYVVMGRETWPSLDDPIVLTATPADACANDVIMITGANPPDAGLSVGRFGQDAGLVDLDGNGWTDLIAGAWYPGSGTSSAQYIYYGAPLPARTEPDACPTDWDLSAADEIIENLGGAVEAVANAPIASNALAGEYAVGVYRDDAVEVRYYDDGSDLVSLYQAVALGESLGDLRFGEGVAYAGDVDRAGGADLVVGSPGRDGGAIESGRVYFVTSSSADPRFSTEPNFWISAAGASRVFGQFVAGDFDYNGDGSPDVAVTDQTNATVTLFY